jgi:hypothetical protein
VGPDLIVSGCLLKGKLGMRTRHAIYVSRMVVCIREMVLPRAVGIGSRAGH